VKKGRHRRYEEARALKRGSDLDINSIFSDLSAETVAPIADDSDDGRHDDDEAFDDFDDDRSEDRAERR